MTFIKSNQLKLPIEILHERGAVFHPVTAIHVDHVAQVADFRTVNVTADHALHPALAAELDHRLFVISDVFYRRLGLQFDIRCERPVPESKTPTDPVHPDVHIQNAVVQGRADPVEEPVEVGQSVKLMAVQNEVPFAVGGRMHGPFDQSHRAETHAEKLFEKLIVVAGEKRYAGFLPVLAKQFLDEQIVFFRPKPFPAQLPAINEIADDIQMLALGFAEEIKQRSYLGMFHSQMNIRDPDGAIVHLLIAKVIHRC